MTVTRSQPERKEEPHAAFIIFCASRSGSTTLIEVLNSHRKIQCLFEPFSRDLHAPGWRQPTSAAELNAAVDDLWQDWNGIKHVADPAGWPFPRGRNDLNHDLLDRDDCNYILLWRRNLLQRQVSAEIAMQTGIWHPRQTSQGDEGSRFTFEALDLEELRYGIGQDKKFIADCRQRLQSGDRRYFELTYEDFFRNSRDEQLKTLVKVGRFLGIPDFAHDPASRQHMLDLLTARATRTDSANLYHRVPNIRQIEDALGNDQTGRLFT